MEHESFTRRLVLGAAVSGRRRWQRPLEAGR